MCPLSRRGDCVNFLLFTLLLKPLSMSAGTGLWQMKEAPAKGLSLCFSHRRHKPAALALTTCTFHVALSFLSLSLSLCPALPPHSQFIF